MTTLNLTDIELNTVLETLNFYINSSEKFMEANGIDSMHHNTKEVYHKSIILLFKLQNNFK